MKDFFNFKDTKVLIVGGHSGLGLEISKAFADAGAHVAIAGRDQNKLTTALAEVKYAGAKTAFAWEVDLSREASVKGLSGLINRDFQGEVNIVINSAGFNVRNLVQNIGLEEWNSILTTNLTGGFLLSREVYPFLKKADFGRLIHVTSIFSSVSYPERSSYSASKGGLIQLMRTLANEWAKDGITVNSISPGPFLTEINKKVLDNPENYRKFCEKIPLGRFGNPTEVVTSAMFLASRHSSYVTGSDIVVDGGWTAS